MKVVLILFGTDGVLVVVVVIKLAEADEEEGGVLGHLEMELSVDDLVYDWFFRSAKKLCLKASDSESRLLGSYINILLMRSNNSAQASVSEQEAGVLSAYR